MYGEPHTDARLLDEYEWEINGPYTFCGSVIPFLRAEIVKRGLPLPVKSEDKYHSQPFYTPPLEENHETSQ